MAGMILTEYDEKKVMENQKREAYEEGRAEGRTEGRAEGKAEGINLMNKLTLKLISLDRINDLNRAASDRAYCDKLIKEFFPDK